MENEKKPIRLTITGASGYVSTDWMHDDIFEMTPFSFSYELQPARKLDVEDFDNYFALITTSLFEKKLNYEIKSPYFRDTFYHICQRVLQIIDDNSFQITCIDAGFVGFKLEFDDGSISEKKFEAPSGFFYDLFKEIKDLINAELSKVPLVLDTDDDDHPKIIDDDKELYYLDGFDEAITLNDYIISKSKEYLVYKEKLIALLKNCFDEEIVDDKILNYSRDIVQAFKKNLSPDLVFSYMKENHVIKELEEQ